MPFYEYSCKKCGETMETFHRVDESPPKRCSHCGGQVTKLFHPAGLVFKGSGFYVTDYGPSKKKGEAKEEKEPKKPEDTKKPSE